jgi:hypothetical protein
LTSPKNKKIINLILISIGISIVVLFIVISDNSCGIRHIAIINDLQTFEKSLDPEFCEELIEKIDDFNYECQPQVEILDCG